MMLSGPLVNCPADRQTILVCKTLWDVPVER